MATVTGYTATRMQAIEDGTVVSGSVDGSGNLTLTKHDGSTIAAGNVMGPIGLTGSGVTIVANAAARPTTGLSEGYMIYQQDTNEFLVWYSSTTGWKPPWNIPWGEIAYVKNTTTDTTGIGNTQIDITGLSVTFTAVAGRKYLVTLMVMMAEASAAGEGKLYLTDNAGTPNVLGQTNLTVAGANVFGMTVRDRESGLASGSVTRKGQIKFVPSTTGTLKTNNSAIILVEDIGPNGNPV